VAQATGRGVGELYAEQDAKVFKAPDVIKEYRPNSGQHYPDFLDDDGFPGKKASRNTDVKVVVKKRALSDEAYAAELDAQRKRAQALAYLAGTDDGVPDDCLRGDAAARRQRQKRSRLEDNTLKLLGERKAKETYAQLQSKLLDVQARLKSTTTTTPSVPATPAPPMMSPAAVVPAGWRAAVHPSSGQTYYVNDATGGTRSTLPPRSEPTTTTARPECRAPPLPEKTRGAVDPLDPMKGRGKWSDAIHHKGERMADSTATGPLWQQRPLPAPSVVLRMRGPGVREEGSSIGPATKAAAASSRQTTASLPPTPSPQQQQRPANKPSVASFVPRHVRRAPAPP